MNMSKSRDIQAKMHLIDKKSQSVFLSFKCILARNCEGTEQLRCRKGLYAEKGESYAEYFLW